VNSKAIAHQWHQWQPHSASWAKWVTRRWWHWVACSHSKAKCTHFFFKKKVCSTMTKYGPLHMKQGKIALLDQDKKHALQSWFLQGCMHLKSKEWPCSHCFFLLYQCFFQEYLSHLNEQGEGTHGDCAGMGKDSFRNKAWAGRHIESREEHFAKI
jgi:hypothetical protein